MSTNIRLRQHGPNRTEIYLGDRTVYFSYETPVIVQVEGVGWYQTGQKFNSTTSRHINGFLDGVPAKIVTQTQLEYLVQGNHPDDLDQVAS